MGYPNVQRGLWIQERATGWHFRGCAVTSWPLQRSWLLSNGNWMVQLRLFGVKHFPFSKNKWAAHISSSIVYIFILCICPLLALAILDQTEDEDVSVSYQYQWKAPCVFLETRRSKVDRWSSLLDWYVFINPSVTKLENMLNRDINGENWWGEAWKWLQSRH